MASVVLACETLKDEVNRAIEETGTKDTLRWVESGLHNYPDKLRARLQEELDSFDGVYDRVLMAFGFCGNSVHGLRTHNFEMILPKVDDCISLLIGSDKKRAEIGKNNGTYFFTNGWLRGERNIWTEHEYTVNKYGRDVAKMVMAGNLQLEKLISKRYPLSDFSEAVAYAKKAEGLKTVICF